MAKQRSALGEIVDFEMLRIQHEIANANTIVPPTTPTITRTSTVTASKLGLGLKVLKTEEAAVGAPEAPIVEDTTPTKRKISKVEGA